MSKSKIIYYDTPEALESRIKQVYLGKYYDLYMNSIKWTGITSEERDYIMRKFWSEGTCCAFRIKGTATAKDGADGMVGFCPWATQTWNMYDFPETVMLINQRGVPFIPNTTQIVNVDVALGWIQRNHKPVWFTVQYYIDRIAQVEMVINTNLELQKMPYLIGVTPDDKKRMEDVVQRILNNELVVFADMDDVNQIKSLVTSTPYIIDKLAQYKVSLENDLLTYLGIDNVGDEKKERLLVDEVNASNDIINDYGQNFIDCLQEWVDTIKTLFGKEITIAPASQPVDSIDESPDGKDMKPEGGQSDGKQN